MDKLKLSRIMKESAFLRETAISSFKQKLNSCTYKEARKLLEEVGAEDEKDLTEKVMSGEIEMEELASDEDNNKEMADEDDMDKEAMYEDSDEESMDDDKPKSNSEKMVKIMERLNRRLEALEDKESEKEMADDEDNSTEAYDDEDTDKEKMSDEEVDGPGKVSDIDGKGSSTGKLPNQGSAKSSTMKHDIDGGDMPESASSEDDNLSESEDADEDDMPQPPVVKESLDFSFSDNRLSEGKKMSGNSLSSLFK